MIFNENGFPKPNGATDWMDSAHYCGMLYFVEHPEAKKKAYKILDYVYGKELLRCPEDYSGLCPANPNNCTRDQFIVYLAGINQFKFREIAKFLLEAAKARDYRAQNTEKDIPGSTKKFPDGPDILDPSHIGYMKICAGLKANWFERLWMLAKIKIMSRISPMSEPNNIVVMSIVYGYANILKKSNPQIFQAIKNYWCENEGAWRGEPELAEMLIKKLEEAK